MSVMQNPAAFFASVREGRLLGPVLTADEVNGCNTLLAAFGKAGWGISYVAYGLATAYHETARSMQPIHEAGTRAYLAKYDTGKLAEALGNTPAADGDGISLAGRGYVQLTGATNYRWASKELGIDLIGRPDLAMRPDIAAQIMVRGCTSGRFTGRSFSNYLPTKGPALLPEFVSCRRVINGVDRAALIAGYAMEFQDAVQLGRWA